MFSPTAVLKVATVTLPTVTSEPRCAPVIDAGLSLFASRWVIVWHRYVVAVIWERGTMLPHATE